MSEEKYGFLEYPEGKTTYEILNENGEKTTISLEKWAADILQVVYVDEVHERIQALYYKICEKYPDLGRKAKGNMIREAAIRKANEYQSIKKELLGWNDDEFLEML